jgi:hypothetical protein
MSPSIDVEIDRNMFAFQSQLSSILTNHRGEFALIRDQQIVELFVSLKGAITAAHERFADNIYSIQEVTDQPIDLGFYSHADNYG